MELIVANAKAQALRIQESREIFARKFFRGDCHLHTRHSDGGGTVAEVKHMVTEAELDFQWVTDHWGVSQAPECREHGLWYGQEPGTRHHHLGILGLDYAFTPSGDLAADVKEAKRQGATVFIPHPAGWWPRTVYSEQQKQALKELESPLLMEVLNGAGNLVTAFDYTDAAAIVLWDELLTAGWQVHGMGNTDAHLLCQIGIVWNGVFAADCERNSILTALRKGNMFISEAPLLDLTVGDTGMGERLNGTNPADPVNIRVADAHGLLQIRLIGDGRPVKTWHPDGKRLFTYEGTSPDRITGYLRVEALSMDGRHGYTNPVYLH